MASRTPSVTLGFSTQAAKHQGTHLLQPLAGEKSNPSFFSDYPVVEKG
jgi:hypothetical protein